MWLEREKGARHGTGSCRSSRSPSQSGGPSTPPTLFVCLNSTVRRAVKAHGHFPSDRAAEKLAFLALRNVAAKWRNPPPFWHAARIELSIHFGERFHMVEWNATPQKAFGLRRGSAPAPRSTHEGPACPTQSALRLAPARGLATSTNAAPRTRRDSTHSEHETAPRQRRESGVEILSRRCRLQVVGGRWCPPSV